MQHKLFYPCKNGMSSSCVVKCILHTEVSEGCAKWGSKDHTLQNFELINIHKSALTKSFHSTSAHKQSCETVAKILDMFTLCQTLSLNKEPAREVYG